MNKEIVFVNDNMFKLPLQKQRFVTDIKHVTENFSGTYELLRTNFTPEEIEDNNEGDERAFGSDDVTRGKLI